MTVSIRLALEEDRSYLVEWLLQPGVLDGFPLADVREVEDAAQICLSYAKQKAAIVACVDDIPCGIANLYLQPYQKLAHHALFVIVVDEKHRGKGIGKKLILELFRIAKERFSLEFLHLEVYVGNPAIHLYQKLGFEVYGVHPNFLKNGEQYVDKILMQKYL